MVEFSPTQKPVALLERIIQASSKPGDVVLELGRHLQESAGIKEKARRTKGIDLNGHPPADGRCPPFCLNVFKEIEPLADEDIR